MRKVLFAMLVLGVAASARGTTQTALPQQASETPDVSVVRHTSSESPTTIPAQPAQPAPPATPAPALSGGTTTVVNGEVSTFESQCRRFDSESECREERLQDREEARQDREEDREREFERTHDRDHDDD